MDARGAAKFLITFGMISTYSGCQEITKDIRIYEGDDFEEVVKTTLFVDKSLLIKRFFDSTKHGSGVLILTPRHFGKSSNINMVKRFFEINVDQSGRLLHAEKTANYNIFRNNYLNIYKLREFFDKNFGRCPVIFIDYKPLSEISKVEEMFAVFLRHIMVETFSQHWYLLNDPHIWTLNKSCSWINKEKFEQYLNVSQNHQLTEHDVRTGFSFLSKLLHKRFETRVTVLIDNYDAYVDSKLYAVNKNIFHFVSAINCDLLRSDSVERSMVTGVIRSSRSVDRGELLPSNIEDSAAEHKLWQYFGLSGVELDQLLQPYVQDDEEREKVIGKIVHDYSGYSVATFEVNADVSEQLLDTQTCSVWSVIKYMEKEMAVENFSSLV